MKILGIILMIAHVAAWCFALWFPFRKRKLAIIAIPVGLVVAFYVSMLIIDTTRAYEFAVALPFAIAAINVISYRDRKDKKKPEPNLGDDAGTSAPQD